jgi:hypothetical protein
VLKRIGKVAALTSATVLLAASAAYAHDEYLDDGAIDNAKATHGHDQQQHGSDDGHLPATDDPDDGLDLVSALRLDGVIEGKIADVGVLGDYAYLAAWGGAAGTCKSNGVYIVDISDVDNPVEVGFIKSKEGSYPGEGVQALSIDTPEFTGDILVTNNEQCRRGVGFGGINLYDVTDPLNWEKLSVGFGDYDDGKNRKKEANETHSVFAWDAGDRAYAVMVDNVEATDVDIVDITDPRKPVLVGEWNLNEAFPQIVQEELGAGSSFLHDMVVKEIDGRFVMLLSYWDGGYVQLDVTDPANPTYLSDSDFPAIDPQGVESGLLTTEGEPVPSEGNAHQAEFAGVGDRFVIGADEDFSPYAVVAKNVDDDTDLHANQGSDTRKLEPGDSLTGETVFVGRACNGDAAVPTGGDGTQIAVVERGACTFTEKVGNVLVAGGYEGVLIFNLASGCEGQLNMSVSGDIPTFGVAPRSEGYALFDVPFDEATACAPGVRLPVDLGTTGDTVTFGSYFDGWGYLRLLDASSMEELDTHAVPEAHDAAFAEGFGDLSVHEVAVSAVDPNIVYVSYYSAGVRVLDVSGGEIVEVAAFIPEGGSNVWGVEVFTGSDGKEYVAASDRDFGLVVFEYAPVNTAP